MNFLKYIQSEKNIGNMLLWVIVLNCFSYPVTSVLIAYLKVPSNAINIGFKSLYLCISVFILFILLNRSEVKIPKIILGALGFYLIYSIRLFIDLSVLEVPILFYTSSYVYSYFFGATLFPILAIIAAYKFLDVRKLTIYIYVTIILSNVLLLYYLLVLSDMGDLEKQLAMRAHIKTEGVKSGTLINPILIGYYGASLVLLTVNLMLFNFFSNKIIKAIFYPLLCLGIIVLLLGASRGPLVGLLVMLVLSLFVNFWQSKVKSVKIIKIATISLMGYFLLSSTISQVIHKYDIHLLYRMEKFFNDRAKGRKEVRDFAFEGAYNDFLSSPAIGNHFVGTYDSFYPHNIFLEVLMATGLIGFLFFGHYFYQFGRTSIIVATSIKYRNYIPLLFTCLLCFFLSITSGSIFSSPDIWILMTLTVLLTHI